MLTLYSFFNTRAIFGKYIWHPLLSWCSSLVHATILLLVWVLKSLSSCSPDRIHNWALLRRNLERWLFLMNRRWLIKNTVCVKEILLTVSLIITSRSLFWRASLEREFLLESIPRSILGEWSSCLDILLKFLHFLIKDFQSLNWILCMSLMVGQSSSIDLSRVMRWISSYINSFPCQISRLILRVVIYRVLSWIRLPSLENWTLTSFEKGLSSRK